MLYPEFKNLLSYENPARFLGYYFGRKNYSNLTGNYLSNFRGQGMEFDEVRAYSYGDDVRKIDWKVSARLGNEDIYVKLFREEREREILIAVDCNDYMNFGTRKTFKNIISARVSAILAFAGNKNREKVGFYNFGNKDNKFNYYKSLSSKKSILLGLKDLCNDKNYKNSYSLDGAIFNLRRLHLSPNILFLISDFRNFSDELEKNLYLMGRKTEIVFIKIVDDSDFLIPDIGDVELKFGDKNFILHSSSKRGRKKYLEKYQNDSEKLQKFAKSLRAIYIEINTKDDIFRKLSLGLMKK